MGKNEEEAKSTRNGGVQENRPLAEKIHSAVMSILRSTPVDGKEVMERLMVRNDYSDWPSLQQRPTVLDVATQTHKAVIALIESRGIGAVPVLKDIEREYEREIVTLSQLSDKDETARFDKHFGWLSKVYAMRLMVMRQLRREYMALMEVISLSPEDMLKKRTINFALTANFGQFKVPQNLFHGKDKLKRNAEEILKRYTDAVKKGSPPLRMRDLRALYPSSRAHASSDSTVTQLQARLREVDLGVGEGFERGNVESFMKIVEVCLETDAPVGV